MQASMISADDEADSLNKMSEASQDSVFIRGLQVEAIIGVYEWEQAITQPLVFDIVMTTSQLTAAKTDNIADAINYKIACERIAELCQSQKLALLETLAERVAQMLLADFSIEKVEVCIHKPTAIKNAASVGVKITRFAKSAR